MLYLIGDLCTKHVSWTQSLYCNQSKFEGVLVLYSLEPLWGFSILANSTEPDELIFCNNLQSLSNLIYTSAYQPNHCLVQRGILRLYLHCKTKCNFTSKDMAVALPPLMGKLTLTFL